MSGHTAHEYGKNALLDTLVENSELANDDAQAITAAIEAQTAVLNQILDTLRRLSSDITQPNTVQTVQNKQIEHQPREKLSKKLLACCDWITANDPDLKLSVRQIAAGAGVSIGTAQAAAKLVSEERSK